MRGSGVNSCGRSTTGCDSDVGEMQKLEYHMDLDGERLLRYYRATNRLLNKLR